MTAWRVYAIVFSRVIVLSGAGRIMLFYKKPGAVSRMDLIAGLFGITMIPGLLGYAYHQAPRSTSLLADRRATPTSLKPLRTLQPEDD